MDEGRRQIIENGIEKLAEGLFDEVESALSQGHLDYAKSKCEPLFKIWQLLSEIDTKYIGNDKGTYIINRYVLKAKKMISKYEDERKIQVVIR